LKGGSFSLAKHALHITYIGVLGYTLQLYIRLMMKVMGLAENF